MRHRRRRAGAMAVAAALVLAGCSGGTDDDDIAGVKADQLAAATQEAGVAPGLTAETAESLYGREAPAVCRAFDGGTSTAADQVLRGHLGLTRKVITDDAVTYGRLVVQVYCPGALDAYDQAVAELDPVDVDRSEASP